LQQKQLFESNAYTSEDCYEEHQENHEEFEDNEPEEQPLAEDFATSPAQPNPQNPGNSLYTTFGTKSPRASTNKPNDDTETEDLTLEENLEPENSSKNTSLNNSG
jgi:hypothetical protein